MPKTLFSADASMILVRNLSANDYVVVELAAIFIDSPARFIDTGIDDSVVPKDRLDIAELQAVYKCTCA